MKAYAYVETYLRNTWSDKPVNCYTLNFGILSVLKYGGPTSMSTTDPGKFQSELSKQMLKGTKVMTNKLPFGVKSIDEFVFLEGGRNEVRTKVIRKPLDKR